jgi:hypothetical protein
MMPESRQGSHKGSIHLMAQPDRRPQPVQNPDVGRTEIIFSHPSEAEFAKLLDYYGIAWRYEPVTYPLQWDAEGNVIEAFSPDFYLVDYDLYVELTTLRPKLMRFKNGKLRRLKELYPELNVKLWRRRDFVYLLDRFGLRDRESALVGKSALEDEDAQAQ